MNLIDLLNRYAQDAGFLDLEDMKSNYTDKAYNLALAAFVRRARAELEAVL